MPKDVEKEIKRLELEKLETELRGLKRERKIPVPLGAGYVGVYAGFLSSIIAIVIFLIPYWDSLKKQEVEKIEKHIARLEKGEETHFAIKSLSRYGKKAIPFLTETYERHNNPTVSKIFEQSTDTTSPDIPSRVYPVAKVAPPEIDVSQVPPFGKELPADPSQSLPFPKELPILGNPQPESPTAKDEPTAVDKDIQIRKNVVEAGNLIARDGVKQIIPLLLEALKDPDSRIQSMATEGLVALDRKAVKHLFKAVQDSEYSEAKTFIVSALKNLMDRNRDAYIRERLAAIANSTADVKLAGIINVALGGIAPQQVALSPSISREEFAKQIDEATRESPFRFRILQESMPNVSQQQIAEGVIKNLGGIVSKNNYELLANGRYRWRVWLEGTEEALSRIDYVVYKLHPTFPQPEVTRTNKGDHFALTAEGWGEFEIKIEVHYEGGKVEVLRHWLNLGMREYKRKR